MDFNWFEEKLIAFQSLEFHHIKLKQMFHKIIYIISREWFDVVSHSYWCWCWNRHKIAIQMTTNNLRMQLASEAGNRLKKLLPASMSEEWGWEKRVCCWSAYHEQFTIGLKVYQHDASCCVKQQIIEFWLGTSGNVSSSTHKWNSTILKSSRESLKAKIFIFSGKPKFEVEEKVVNL